MLMPKHDQSVIDRRAELAAALRDIVPGEGVIDSDEELRAFDCDGLMAYKQVPLIVVLPETTQQV